MPDVSGTSEPRGPIEPAGNLLKGTSSVDLKAPCVLLNSFLLSDITPELDSEFSRVLSRCPFSTPFHTIEWNRLLAEEFSLSPQVTTARVDGELVAYNVFYTFADSFHLKSCWSPPRMLESVYGGPVFVPELAESGTLLLMEQERLSRAHTAYVICPPGFDSGILHMSGYSVFDAKTVVVDLGVSVEELWQRLGQKRRNMVRKAEKENVLVRKGTAEETQTYYRLLEGTLSRSAGLPSGYPSSLVLSKRLYLLAWPHSILQRLTGELLQGLFCLTLSRVHIFGAVRQLMRGAILRQTISSSGGA